MKKSLFLLSFLIVLAVFFLAGARFGQRGIPRDLGTTSERQILHYVDPMNPANISSEPGIAPCGMPMEPVYADDDTFGLANGMGSSLSVSPGAVKINLRKQQIIGVQVGEVTHTKEILHLRALGRITPDENQVYPLISATDGWLEEINESTTGSLVNENQLLAQIKVYNYDFFSWQQRFRNEIGYTRYLGGSASPLTDTDYSRRRVTSGAGYQAGLPIPESEARLIRRRANISQMAHDAEHRHVAEPQSSAASRPDSEAPTENAPTGSSPPGMLPTTPQEPTSAPELEHTENMGEMAKGSDEEPGGSRKRNLLYGIKGRMELLNLGIEENQLKELAEKENYITHVDIRSPVNGYVLSRNVSSLQKIDRGVECFRIADLSRVWVEADVYEGEVKHIHPGMQARVSRPKQGQSSMATVSEVLPRYDAVSRSLKVRLILENPELIFRPDMFVDVEFLMTFPESISVPTGAVIDSGKRKTVYVVKGEGVFEPREVATGWQLNDRVEIVEGLQSGEQIVVAGNFLIDSDSRMKLAALRLMEDKAERPNHEQAAPAAVSPPPAAPSLPEPQIGKQPITPVEKSKDPVCGMMVRHDRAVEDDLTFDVDGRTYFFCSAECKEQFRQDPQRFLAEPAGGQAAPPSPAHGGHHHD